MTLLYVVRIKRQSVYFREYTQKVCLIHSLFLSLSLSPSLVWMQPSDRCYRNIICFSENIPVHSMGFEPYWPCMTFYTCASELKSSCDTDAVILMYASLMSFCQQCCSLNPHLEICRTSYLTHRSNGAWSWCVWCPTTHIRGWCHVYRDTSAQMQRRDM